MSLVFVSSPSHSVPSPPLVLQMLPTTTVPAVGVASLSDLGPAIGRKVKRYWGHDAKAVAKNKGNPW